MSELSRALQGLEQQYSPVALKSAYEALSQAYRSGKPIRLETPELQLAYLQARMPATVAVLTEVLSQIDSAKSLLDLGAGPGSVLWAAQAAGLEISEATCVDQSAGLLSFGRQLLEQSDIQTATNWLKADITNKSDLGEPDLLTMSYVLNELGPADQQKLIEKAWRAAGRYLILVEPGTPRGFQNILRAREYLVSGGANIAAPCTHENPCPMAGSDWCHFSVRLERSRTHKQIKGSLSYEDEKYSYLIVSKNPIPNRPASRIVKRPSSSSGLVELELCGPEGLSRVKVSKRQGELFKQARKAEWGDGWFV